MHEKMSPGRGVTVERETGLRLLGEGGSGQYVPRGGQGGRYYEEVNRVKGGGLWKMCPRGRGERGTLL